MSHLVLILQIEHDALATLKREGMTLHALSPESWRRYRDAQPAWERFLDETLPADQRLRLLAMALASARAPDGPGLR